MLKKAILVPLFVIVIAGGVFARGQVPEWVEFSSLEGRFKIRLPAKPTIESKEIETKVGKLTLYNHSASNSTGYFIVSYADYPFEPTDAKHAEEVLDNVRDGVLKGIDAPLISEEKLVIAGHPGRSFSAKKKLGDINGIFHWRLTLVGKRLYQLAAVTPETGPGQLQLPKFFSSFALNK